MKISHQLISLALCGLSAAAQAQIWTDLPSMDQKADVITQRADSPIYSRMAVDKKYREFAYSAINVRGEQLGYKLVLESREALFTDKSLRKVYEAKAGNYFVSYWVRESPNYRKMPFKRNVEILLVVVDTVPANKDTPEFKAVASKLPYVTYQIRWQQFSGNQVVGIKGDDTGSAVKWNCKTKEGKVMPTMIQTMIIHKPNFKNEEEWYRTAYYITDTGELKDNGAGRRNICTERSVGPDDEVSKWVRFFGGV
jgi:hypothetical protein